MLLHSTAESVDKGEISLLAIAETILATAIAIYLSVEFNSFKWIAWSACIAPLLLLRTEQSTALGINLLDDCFAWVQHHHGKWFDIVETWNPLLSIPTTVILGLLMVSGTAIVAALIRLAAILTTVCRHRLTSIFAIPANWARATLAVDVCCPPEIVPGYHLEGKRVGIKVSSILSQMARIDKPQFLVMLTTLPLFYFPLLILLYAPPLLYRWSLKATSIIYTPLLWIVWSTSRAMPDISAALTRIRKSDLTKIVLIYSVLVIAAFMTKFILMIKWANFAAWWNTTPLTEFFAIYIAPTEIPLWQFVAFINAFWAIVVFVFVKEALIRMDTPEAWSPKGVESLLRVSSFGRCVLTLYTVACTGYLTVQAATSWNLPRLGTKLFPWMN